MTADPFGMKGATASQMIAKWAGFYIATGALLWAPLADTTKRYIYFAVNGSGVFYEFANPNWNSGSLSYAIATSGLFYLNAGDYIEVIGRQDSGGNLTATGQLAMAWVAP